MRKNIFLRNIRKMGLSYILHILLSDISININIYRAYIFIPPTEYGLFSETVRRCTVLLTKWSVLLMETPFPVWKQCMVCVKCGTSIYDNSCTAFHELFPLKEKIKENTLNNFFSLTKIVLNGEFIPLSENI